MDHQNDQALKVALAAVDQLTLKQRLRLTERLLSTTIRKENLIILYLQGLPPRKRERLATLMDKNNNARLSRREQLELKKLGSEVDEILFKNSHALAYALRPELFDAHGQPIKSRFQQAVKTPSQKRSRRNREDGL